MEEQTIKITIKTRGEKCDLTDEQITEWYRSRIEGFFNPEYGTPEIAIELERRTDWEGLKEQVQKKGFGSVQYGNINGEAVYLSRGIRELFLQKEGGEQKLIEAVMQFQQGEFGDAGEMGKDQRPGHEYGHYALTGMEADEDTGVWMHRTEDAVKVYLSFER